MSRSDTLRFTFIVGVATVLLSGVATTTTAVAATPAVKGAANAPAAPRRVGKIVVTVVPERADWKYNVGDKVGFLIRVTRDGHPVPGARVHYELGPEQMPPTHGGDIDVPAAGIAVDSEPIGKPGFVVCTAEIEEAGHKYSGRGAAGISPEKIEPTVDNPDDFDAFWLAGKEQLAGIAIDAKLTPAPERSRPGADCFHVSVANVPVRANQKSGGSGGGQTTRIYGILCEPQGPGPFPALLQVPGAGVRAYTGMPEITARGVITFQIGIHGIPVNFDNEVYDVLGRGALDNYMAIQNHDRDHHYYRRVFLGTLRANDFLTTRPRWDRHNLGVTGGSQGGALSIVTAALDARVRALVSYYPALSDHSGFLHGRTGGWPFMFRQESARTPERVKTMAYYDVVNFARRVRVPGFYVWGYNDPTCPPTTMFSVYNVVTAPKQLLLALETGHFIIPEETEASDAWMFDQLHVPSSKTATGAKKSTR